MSLDGNDRSIAIAPDGSRVAYLGGNGRILGSGVASRLYSRALDRLDAVMLAGPGQIREPFFSPDGAWIGFFGPTSALQKIAATGGPSIQLALLDGASRGATWGDDGSIIFATNDGSTGLQRISANGGPIEVLTRPDQSKGERDHLWPHFLPGGRHELFTIARRGTAIDSAQVAVFDLRQVPTHRELVGQ